jgi:hypothetical protein
MEKIISDFAQWELLEVTTVTGAGSGPCPSTESRNPETRQEKMFGRNATESASRLHN